MGLGFREAGETVRGLAGWNILVPVVGEENMGWKRPALLPCMSSQACDKGRVFRQEARGASGQASRKNRERI